MALTKIPGNLVDFQISTALVTPVWKKIVCGTDASLDGSVDTTSVATKCGTLKARGSVSWTASGSAVANQTPGANEVSVSEVSTMFQAGTQVRFKMAHVTTESIFYAEGQGTFSAATLSAGVEDNLSFDWTLEVDGDIDFTA
jgi:hypothetical protein